MYIHFQIFKEIKTCPDVPRLLEYQKDIQSKVAVGLA